MNDYKANELKRARIELTLTLTLALSPCAMVFMMIITSKSERIIKNNFKNEETPSFVIKRRKPTSRMEFYVMRSISFGKCLFQFLL